MTKAINSSQMADAAPQAALAGRSSTAAGSLWLTAAAVFLAAVALFAVVQWATPGIVGNDGSTTSKWPT